MATSLHIPFLEVTGKVKWTSRTFITSDPNLNPGKLSILTLADSFYFQIAFDSGRKNKRFKLKPDSVVNVTCRGTRFTCYFKTKDDEITAILANGEKPNLESFSNWLEDFKNGRKPVVPGGKIPSTQETPQKHVNGHLPSPASKVTAKPLHVDIKEKSLTVDGKDSGGKTPQKDVNDRLPSSASKVTAELPHSDIKEKTLTVNVDRSCDVIELDSDHFEEQPDRPKQTSSFIQSPRTPQQRKTPLIKCGRNSSIKKDLFDSEKNRQKAVKNQNAYNKENSRRTKSSDLSNFGSVKKQPLSERTTQNVASPMATTSPTVKPNSFYGSKDRSKPSLAKYPKKATTTPKRSVFSGVGSPPKKTHHFISGKSPTSPLVKSYLENQVTSQGFTNLGNTCYMNSTLQSLLRLYPFVHDLSNKTILELVNRSSLCRCMYNLFCCRDETGFDSNKENCLKRLKNALTKSEMTERFSGYRQNDAHEFMNICLDQMKEEVRKGIAAKTTKANQNDRQAKLCPIVKNFEGCIRKFITCLRCGDLVTKDEMFNHLSLNIPRSESSPVVALSLEKLLSTFFHEEEVERKCDKCECTRAVHSFKIQALPRIMIFHMLRNAYHKSLGTQEKKSDKIQASRYIDMDKFCNSDVKGPISFSMKAMKSPSNSLNNETPTSDLEDFVVKSRRRLDLSNCGKTPSNWKQSENDLPDWAKNYKATPKLSSEKAFYSNELSNMTMEEQIKLATLESLKTTTPDLSKMSEDEQLRLATLESLRTKQQEDNTADDWMDYGGLSWVSDTELLEAEQQHNNELANNDERPLENQIVPGSSKTKESFNGESTNIFDKTKDNNDEPLADEKGSKNTDEMSDVSNSRKRASSEYELTVVNKSNNNGENTEGRELIKECGDSVTKKRKVMDEDRTMEKNVKEDFDLSTLKDESDQMERVLEESKNLTDIEKLEEMEIAEATKRSLIGSRVDKTTTERNNKKCSHQYRLVSVVSHIGSNTQYGHYISDVLDLKAEQWIRFNDTQAEKINEHHVRYYNGADGYIYFYMHKNLTEQLLPQKPKKMR